MKNRDWMEIYSEWGMWIFCFISIGLIVWLLRTILLVNAGLLT